MKITQKLSNRKNYGQKRALNRITYIVIHMTANDGDKAVSNANYFANGVRGASAHYFVDDSNIYQSVPDNYVAWSVGGKKYLNCSQTGGGKLYGKCTNSNSISIELCDTVKNGIVYPTDKTINLAIKVTKSLMKKYNISKKNIVRHFDVTGKSCPSYWTNDAKWKKEFLNKISEEIVIEDAKYCNTRFERSYTVKSSDGLNMRSKASTEGTVICNIPNGSLVTCDGFFNINSNGTKWLRVTYNGKIGYCSSVYLVEN